MKSVPWLLAAAFAEIAGCYAFWLWLRLQRGPLPLLFGLPALLLFAFALTRVDAASAGRVYAAYSAIYLLASLVWMRGVEGISPDRWDLIGSGVCLVGAGIIMLAPR
jgi:small multidrug resistance family-3 protein